MNVIKFCESCTTFWFTDHEPNSDSCRLAKELVAWEDQYDPYSNTESDVVLS